MFDTSDVSPTTAGTRKRYGTFSSENALVVYDRTEPTAWLLSDTTVDPAENV